MHLKYINSAIFICHVVISEAENNKYLLLLFTCIVTLLLSFV